LHASALLLQLSNSITIGIFFLSSKQDIAWKLMISDTISFAVFFFLHSDKTIDRYYLVLMLFQDFVMYNIKIVLYSEPFCGIFIDSFVWRPFR
jgi:hypothetical protein